MMPSNAKLYDYYRVERSTEGMAIICCSRLWNSAVGRSNYSFAFAPDLCAHSLDTSVEGATPNSESTLMCSSPTAMIRIKAR